MATLRAPLRRRATRGTLVLTSLGAGQLLAAAPARADLPDPLRVIAGPISQVVGGISGWGFDQVASGIVHWVLGAVDFFVNGALDFLRSTARPDVEAAWFSGAGSPYATARNMAGLLLAGFAFLGIIHGLISGDPAGMLRRMAGRLPAAVAGMVVATVVVAKLLELTDSLSSAVLANTGNQALHFLSGLGAAATASNSGFAVVVLGLVALLAGLLLWVELIVRASLVYLLVAFSPLAFAASVWPAARSIVRRLTELLLAVVFSKFAVCLTLAIGVASLSGAGAAGTGSGLVGGAGDSVGTLLAGTVLVGLAAFSPFVVLKLLPLAEAAIVAQGISRAPARAAQTALATASSASMVGRLAGVGLVGASSTSRLGPGRSGAEPPDRATAERTPTAGHSGPASLSGRGGPPSSTASPPAIAGGAAAARKEPVGRDAANSDTTRSSSADAVASETGAGQTRSPDPGGPR